MTIHWASFWAMLVGNSNHNVVWLDVHKMSQYYTKWWLKFSRTSPELKWLNNTALLHCSNSCLLHCHQLLTMTFCVKLNNEPNKVRYTSVSSIILPIYEWCLGHQSKSTVPEGLCSAGAEPKGQYNSHSKHSTLSSGQHSDVLSLDTS